MNGVVEHARAVAGLRYCRTMAGRKDQRLATYRRKRDFGHTPEPARTPRKKRARAKSVAAANSGTARFVIHLHHASHRHFDLRLQVGGTLRSWAVPKGPSRDPSIKRLAVEVEDHPLDYATFEGAIPKGHYGAGTVAIWDEGTWGSDEPVKPQLEKGHLRFELHGARLRGAWSLIRTDMKAAKPQWLLIKGDDTCTESGDVADDTPLSEWMDATSPRKSAPDAPPGDIGFQLARLHTHAPGGEEWLHEIKYDGYRMLGVRDGKRIRLTSRNDLDWTDRLPHVARAIGALDCRDCVLDGELVVYDAQGHTRFDLLQQQFSSEIADATRYAVFDLLFLDGEDVRALPLRERKSMLAKLFDGAENALKISEFIRGHGAMAFKRACEAGLEGIISKAEDSIYRAGRSDTWRKLKCIDSGEFLIIGFNRGHGARSALGALLLAEPHGDGWRYVGRVGTGFNDALLEDLQKQLRATDKQPKLDNPPGPKQLRGARPIWVQPRHVAEVEFRGRTGDDMLRQASFKGLRPDKSPDDLRDSDRVKPRSFSAMDGNDMTARKSSGKSKSSKVASNQSAQVKLTHPDRVLIGKPRVTKRDLADFYLGLAGYLLPGIVNRPLSLVRCPDGIAKECFFQKHGMAGMPDALRTVAISGDKQKYLYVEDIQGVIALVQMNALEIHPWGSTIDDIEHPDRIVFDLDPGPGVPWKRMIAAARALRQRLRAIELESFVRTTGGKGLHVVLPLNPRPGWTTAKSFAQAMARTLEAEAPHEFVATAAKSKRKDRIFIDYLRNARGATAVASYCMRARESAGVATPLRWEELAALRSGAQYTIRNIPRRVAGLKRDPWQGIDTIKQTLPKLSRGEA